VFEDEALEKPVAFGLATAEPGRDYCVKVEVDGLEPGTDYYYRFEARTSQGQERSPRGRTRSAPALDASRPVRLAVISCSNYPFGYFNVYREIGARDDLDAVVHLGDYIYEYGVDGYGGETEKTEMTLRVLRALPSGVVQVFDPLLDSLLNSIARLNCVFRHRILRSGVMARSFLLITLR